MRSKFKILKGIVSTKLGFPRPVFCQWEVTSRCNMRCDYCNITKGKSIWEPELDTKGALKTVDQLSQLGVVILNMSGGEPMLREDLGKIIRRARINSMNTLVATNGWFLEDRISLLDDADAIRVSIDGIGKFHDRYRGKGSYKRCVDGIKALQERGKSVAINSVVTTETPINQVYKLCELAEELGVQISLSACTPGLGYKSSPKLSQVHSRVTALKIKSYSDYIDLVNRLRKRYGEVIADPPVFNRIIAGGGLEKFGCAAMSIDVAIKPDGSLAMPCDGWAAESAKGNLVEIWKGNRVKRVRAKVGKYDFCQNCMVKCHMYGSVLMKPHTLLELGLTYRI